jgi:two-component system, LuxR family, sensor kinase FixL
MQSESLAKLQTFGWAYQSITFLAAIAIFLVDTFTSLETAIAVLYAVVVMVSASFLNRRGILIVSGACMLMTVMSYLIVHGGTTHSGPLIRGLISLCAISITTFLALKNQEATQNLAYQASLLDLTHDAIVARDMDGVITYWNAGAEELYGWKSEEAVGLRMAELLETTLPTSLESILDQLQQTSRWQGELLHTRRDGTRVVVASRWSLHRDKQGRPVATISTNNDITEQKASEDALSELRSELAHVARVSTLGELTASIAHEINQPLAAVVANGDACLRWLARDVPDLKEVRLSVERMIGNGQRASEVVKRLRALARKDRPSRSEFTMNEIVEDVLPLLEREVLRHCVKVVLELEPRPLSCLGDRVQMQQVFINLVMNAVQSMSNVEERSRTLTIRTRNDDADSTPAVLLEVADNGVGIDVEVANELFKPFFTTKNDGMGMGLSICRSIVEAHGGEIFAGPAREQGASFSIRIPIRNEAET